MIFFQFLSTSPKHFHYQNNLKSPSHLLLLHSYIIGPWWLPAHCLLALLSSEALYAGVVCFLNVNNDLPVITADQSTEWALPSCLYPRVWFLAPQAITVHLAACKGNCTALLLRLFSSVEGWRHTVLKKGLFFSILFYSIPFHTSVA